MRLLLDGFGERLLSKFRTGFKRKRAQKNYKALGKTWEGHAGKDPPDGIR